MDPLDPTAHQRVEEWASGSAEAQTSAWFEVVVGSEDPDDLTIKQSRLLGEADAICIHGDVPEGILACARADAERLTCDPANCAFAVGPTDPDTVPACSLSSAQRKLNVILRYQPKG